VPEVASLIDGSCNLITGTANGLTWARRIEQVRNEPQYRSSQRTARREVGLLHDGRDVLIEKSLADWHQTAVDGLNHVRADFSSHFSKPASCPIHHMRDNTAPWHAILSRVALEVDAKRENLPRHCRQSTAPLHRVVYKRRVHDEPHGLALERHDGAI